MVLWVWLMYKRMDDSTKMLIRAHCTAATIYTKSAASEAEAARSLAQETGQYCVAMDLYNSAHERYIAAENSLEDALDILERFGEKEPPLVRDVRKAIEEASFSVDRSSATLDRLMYHSRLEADQNEPE